MMRKYIVILSLMTMFFTVDAAYAGTVTSGLQVRAEVPAVSYITTTDMDFGQYYGREVHGQASISVTATTGTPYTIALSTGNSGTYTQRHMIAVEDEITDLLNYNLYPEGDEYEQVWGDGIGDTAIYSGTGTGVSQMVSVEGEVPGGQIVASAYYSDSIVVTVSY